MATTCAWPIRNSGSRAIRNISPQSGVSTSWPSSATASASSISPCAGSSIRAPAWRCGAHGTRLKSSRWTRSWDGRSTPRRSPRSTASCGSSSPTRSARSSWRRRKDRPSTPFRRSCNARGPQAGRNEPQPVSPQLRIGRLSTAMDPRGNRRRRFPRTPARSGSPATGKSVPMLSVARRSAIPGRDLRLDFFRGLALWLVFLDHIPSNVVSWITIRNYGLSDASEIFIFISGYTASLVYGRAIQQHGFVIAAARILRRCWQIYVAHLFLFVFYIAEITNAASRFHEPLFAEETHVLAFLQHPDATIVQALLLKFKPVNLDVLPIYILFLLAFPAVLWLLRRNLALPLAASAVLYALTWMFQWNCRRIRRASGFSIRSRGSCCSCSARGAQPAAPNACKLSCARASPRCLR